MKSLQRKVFGGKVCTSHHTMISEAQDLVLAVKRCPEITKIASGKIARTGGPVRLKIGEVPVGIKVTVRGHSAVQTLFFHTQKRAAVWRIIQNAWEAIYPSAVK